MRASSFVLAVATIILAQTIDPAVSHALVGIDHAVVDAFSSVGHLVADILNRHPFETTFRIATVVPLAVPTRVAWQMMGISNAFGYVLIKKGEIDSYLEGRVRKVVVASIHAYIERKLAAAKKDTAPVRTEKATIVSLARRAERKAAESSRGRPRTKPAPTSTAASTKHTVTNDSAAG
jgi:hypothetical protein